MTSQRILGARHWAVFFFASVLWAIVTYQAHGQTTVSGNQKGTWTKASSPYLVVGNVTVAAGDTLIIEPGVGVYVQNTSTSITVQGVLQAAGTETDSIKFTSDDTVKTGGQWIGIAFAGRATGTLAYCVVEAAGNHWTGEGYGVSARDHTVLSISHTLVRKIENSVVQYPGHNSISHGIIASCDTTTLTNVRIDDIEGDGILAGSGDVTLVGSEISRCLDDGVEFYAKNGNISGSDIHDNGGNGVEFDVFGCDIDNFAGRCRAGNWKLCFDGRRCVGGCRDCD